MVLHHADRDARAVAASEFAVAGMDWRCTAAGDSVAGSPVAVTIVWMWNPHPPRRTLTGDDLSVLWCWMAERLMGNLAASVSTPRLARLTYR